MIGCLFFFFKQKTAYEMRVSDWSSDVCSSDLVDLGVRSTYRGMDTPGNRRSNGAMPIRRATVELWDIHDRMPVILHPDEHETWLLAPSDEAMRRYPAEQLVVDPRAQPIDHKALSRNQLFDADKTGIPAAKIGRAHV